MIKLSKWAKEQGISYKTAWKWFNDGNLPVPAIKLHTGTIMVDIPVKNNLKENNVIYCRVSNHSRKLEIKYQENRCSEFSSSKGIVIHKIYSEIASGLNDNRKEFWRMIESKPTKIIVENKDRLTRFGFNYLKKLLSEQGTEIIVINESKEDEQDLIKDLVSIIYSFCARLYGMRRAANKAKQVRDLIEIK